MQCDPNGNGYVSVAELGKLIIELELDSALPPAVQMRAFQVAKDVHKVREKRSEAADYVEKDEFRWLFLYLHKYCKLFIMFDAIDMDDDKRITKEELSASVGSLAKWGCEVTQSDIGTLFSQLDVDGGGKILFQEFADWALKNNTDMIGDQAQTMFDLILARSGKATANAKSIPIQSVVDALRGMGFNPTAEDVKQFDANKDGAINLTEFVTLCKDFQKRKGVKKEGGKDPEVEKMIKLLKRFDKDGSGCLNKAEVQVIMCSMGNEDSLNDGEFKALMKDLDTNKDGKISINEMASVLVS